MLVTVQDEATVRVSVDTDPDAAFNRICRQNPKLRVEQTSEGEILVMSPAGNESSIRNVEIVGQLRNWAKQDGQGMVFDSNTVFRLPDLSKLGPDAAWASVRQLATFTSKQRKKFLPLAPEFVIELKSPTDRIPKLHDKMRRWIANGVELAWLLDADERRVWIYANTGSLREEIAPTVVLGEGSVAGFQLVMEDIYRGLNF